MKDGAFISFVVSIEGMIYRSFEDHKRTLEEIKFLFFKTLYLSTFAYVSPLLISYHDFLVLFAPN